MRPYVISNNISLASVAIIEEQNKSFSGISISVTALRSYPMETLASHVLGYIGPISESELKNNEGYSLKDYIGKSGIEYTFEKFLRGEDGIKQTDMSIEGILTGEYVTKEAIAGHDVVLTIDANLQLAAETALKNNIEKIRTGGFGQKQDAKGGSVVVLDVRNGDVLAMCSYPDFEPELFIDGVPQEKWNEYTDQTNLPLINRALQSAYAPGSTFKMVTAIAGLSEEVITLDERIHDTGVYPRGHKPKCWIYSLYGGGHGSLNVTGAIKHSCNYFFFEVGSRLGIEAIEEYARYFGLGEKSGIELRGEVSGTLAGKTLYDRLGETWNYGSTLSAAIGQAENNFTPLSMARYIGILVNGGQNIDVTIVKDIVDSDGKKINRNEINNYVAERLGITKTEKEDMEFQEEYIAAILEGMRSVTTETGGTAYSIFRDFDIEIGGKTGSAEAGIDIETKKNIVNAWFVGFAPYDNPEIAIVVLVENGAHGYYTAEIAKEILGVYFGLNTEIKENREAIPLLEMAN